MPLDTLLVTLPPDASTLYLHDLALLPAARGTGAAAEAVRSLRELARGNGLASLSLVAVSGSAGFWMHQGFRPKRGAAPRELLAYGGEATVMEG